jgi:hypothetical protein
MGKLAHRTLRAASTTPLAVKPEPSRDDGYNGGDSACRNKKNLENLHRTPKHVHNSSREIAHVVLLRSVRPSRTSKSTLSKPIVKQKF